MCCQQKDSENSYVVTVVTIIAILNTAGCSDISNGIPNCIRENIYDEIYISDENKKYTIYYDN